MKRYIAVTVVTAALFLLLDTGGMTQPLKLKVNTMTVLGTSTLHDWESQVTKAEWKGTIQVDNLILTAVRNIEVRIPVESIKSTKGKLMDTKTYDAFNYEKYPFIIYTLTSATINQTAGTIETNGTLSMAGVTKPIDITAKYKVLASGEVQIVVNKKIKMPEFKIEPPTAMMGTIKVGEEVTVNFDVTINTKLIQ